MQGKHKNSTIIENAHQQIFKGFRIDCHSRLSAPTPARWGVGPY